MDKRMDIFGILKNEGRLTTLLVYPAVEVKVDPYEKNTTKSFLNPVSVKALVNSLSFESLKWKYFGQMPMGSRQVICEKKWYNLFKIADKIKIGEEYYKTYKDDSKGFAIIEREDYIAIILEKKLNG